MQRGAEHQPARVLWLGREGPRAVDAELDREQLAPDELLRRVREQAEPDLGLPRRGHHDLRWSLSSPPLHHARGGDR